MFGWDGIELFMFLVKWSFVFRRGWFARQGAALFENCLDVNCDSTKTVVCLAWQITMHSG